MRHNMRAERARKGMTVEQVADAIGVHANAVHRWEHGDSEPLATNIVALSKLYGCSPEYLLDMTDAPDGVAVADGA